MKSNAIVIIFLFGVAILYPLSSKAAFQPVDILVDTGAVLDVTVPNQQICSTSNGHVYAVWYDYRNGPYSDIYFNYSSDYGLTWQPADKRIDTTGALDILSKNPQISCTENGNVYVVWEENGLTGC